MDRGGRADGGGGGIDGQEMEGVDGQTDRGGRWGWRDGGTGDRGQRVDRGDGRMEGQGTEGGRSGGRDGQTGDGGRTERGRRLQWRAG